MASTRVTVQIIWGSSTVAKSAFLNDLFSFSKLTLLSPSTRLDGTSLTADRLLQIKQDEIRRMQEQLSIMQEQLRASSRPVSNAQSMDDLLNE